MAGHLRRPARPRAERLRPRFGELPPVAVRGRYPRAAGPSRSAACGHGRHVAGRNRDHDRGDDRA